MTGSAAMLVAALCLCATTANAGIVEQYEASSDAWQAAQAGTDPCRSAERYDEMMADIDLALVKGQLILVQPRMRYLDLGDEDRRELRAFYTRLEQARGEAGRRCGR